MFTPSPPNLRRQKLRKECREALATHIESRTEVKVLPSEVRLSPSETAPYWWRILRPEAEVLFLKPLSRCTVGDCQNIISQLGDGFEACPKIPNRSPTEQIMPENGKKNKDENQDETIARINCVAPTEQSRYTETIRQFEHDIALYQSRIEELERKVTKADEEIVGQESRIFQFDLMVGRMGQLLQDYQQYNQTYNFE